ncbi:MAG: hypothetical protein AAF940_00805 [Pseudomonadota bacterium]
MADLPPPEPGEHIDVTKTTDPCEKSHTWRRYRKTGKVAISFYAVGRPLGVPEARKHKVQQLADLEAKADATIERLNRRPVPKCGKGCDYLASEEKRITGTMTVRSRWDERFTLIDDEGNIITGTARYLAEGMFPVETIIHTKHCAPIAGDAAPDFFKTADTAGEDEAWKIKVKAKFDLYDWFKNLPDEEKKYMDLDKPKKSGGK